MPSRKGGGGGGAAFELMVAVRYLRGARERSWLSLSAAFSLAGIAVGVAALIVVLAVMTGLSRDLLGRIIGVDSHITVVGGVGGLADHEALAKALSQIEGVRHVAAVVDRQAMASIGGRSLIARIKGIGAEVLAARPAIAAGVPEGAVEAFDAGETVLVGRLLARSLGIGPGQNLTLVATTTVPDLPTAIVPIVAGFRVGGLFQVGAEKFDSRLIYMPIATARRFFGLEGGATGIEITVADPLRLDAVRGRIAAAVAGRAGSVKVVDWQEANRQLFVALQVERVVMSVILGLVVLVAAFNILTGLVVMVKRQSRGLAILRTMGAGRGALIRIFVLNGALIGGAGTAIGAGLGVALALNVEAMGAALRQSTGQRLTGLEAFVANLPTEVRPGDVAWVVVLALGLSLVATLYPAWRAARLDPVEALRYE